ncbi:hypothetical protein [Arsenicicoccus dermatophilus]|uniref:hypothetical protein n=1 Tax=Arsenicicoccus dermatophilus TaxID=1076331 RepID=UPI0039170F2D
MAFFQGLAEWDHALPTGVTLHGRSGLGVDVAHDREALARGRSIGCPTLVGWTAHDDLEQLYGDPSLLWRRFVSESLTGARIDSSHHLAEEDPAQVTDTLDGFLRRALA